MNKVLRISLTVIALAFLVWAFFFVREGTMRFFTSMRTQIGSLFTASSSAARVEQLSLKVKDLEFALEKANASSTFEGRYHYKIARVYSEYPYNDGGKLVIDAGSADGLRAGMPVMASEGVLLGRVATVRRTQSEVMTVFSPEWKSSVGIGTDRVKAVLEGGLVPMLTLIPKDTTIGDDASVVNLSPDYPLDARIGAAAHAIAVPNDVWQKAELEPLYRFEGLSTVLVVTDFP